MHKNDPITCKLTTIRIKDTARSAERLFYQLLKICFPESSDIRLDSWKSRQMFEDLTRDWCSINVGANNVDLAVFNKRIN